MNLEKPASRKARFAAIDFIPPQLEKQIRSEGIKGDPKYRLNELCSLIIGKNTKRINNQISSMR